MQATTTDAIQLAKLLLDFLSSNIWPIAFLVFLIIGRKAISSFLERVTKFTFKLGDASGNVEAVAPKTGAQERPSEITAPEVSKPQLPSSEAVEVVKEEKKKDWFGNMMEAFDRGDTGRAREIFETHQRDEKDPDQRHTNEALFLYFLYVDGKEDTALRRLEEHVERSANDQQLQRSAIWLASCYSASKDYTKAEALWLRSIAKVRGALGKTELLVRLASVYQAMGEAQKGADLIVRRLREINDPQGKAMLYSALADIEKDRGNKEIAALALEKAIEFEPANRERLFDAAYLQNEATLSVLALANYQTLIALDQKHAAALNNLAVTAGEFDLKGKQVVLYKQAIVEGNTLAMANLANLQINAGFWDEAKSVLDSARKSDEPHENVGNALYRLKSSEDEEDSKWKTLNKRAVEFKRKVRKYGECYFESGCAGQDFEGTWFTEKGNQVLVERNGGKLVASWSEGTLGGLIGGHLVYKINISGSVTNCSAKITYQRSSDQPRSLLAMAADQKIGCYSYIDDSKKVLLVFSENPKDEFELILKREVGKG